MSTINIFNRKLSFFGDSIIYRIYDAWGDILVIEHSNFRNLAFDLIYEQSSMNVKKPHILVHEYTQAMMLVLAFIKKPRHVSILGLGGGCLLRSLHHILPECELHAVELRPRVYEVANDFFGIPESDQITVTINDAKQWLKNTADSSTNVIFADMYHAYSMDRLQMQKSFITQCHRVLNDAGWLVINYHKMPDVNTAFFKCIAGLFSDIFVCPTSSGNHILFASKQPIDALHHFQLEVAMLEQKLENPLSHLFKRLKRLKSTNYLRN